MKKEIELAQRAVELAMLISEETTADAWFDYSGHVDVVSARYCPDGWKVIGDGEDRTINTECIVCSSVVSEKTLQYIVNCFKFIYAVAERKSNA